MFNYIHGELYKVIRRKYLMIILVVLAIIMVGLAKILTSNILFSSAPFSTRTGILSLSIYFIIGLNALLLIFVPLFTDDFRYNTLKNLVSYDLNMFHVFLGKFIVQIIVAIIFAVILFPVLGLLIQLLPPGEGYTNKMLIEFYLKIFSAIPCLAASIAIADYISLLIKNELVVCLLYYYGYIQIYALILYANLNSTFNWIKCFIMPAQIGSLFYQAFSVRNCVITIVSGILYTVLFLILIKKQVKIKYN